VPEEFADSESEPGTESHRTVFKTKPKLPSSNVVKRTLEELVDLMNGPYLDINPDYQRGVVWKHPRMSGLIDSLIENYYVPPVIFNLERVAGPNGTTIFKRICVDGKQRLTSIKEFMEGKIGCHDSHNQTWYYCYPTDAKGNINHRSRRILPESVKEEFRLKELICYELLDLSRSQEEDLFSRVQLGVQLTVAEKLRATAGTWHELVKVFETKFSSVVECKPLLFSLFKSFRGRQVPLISTRQDQHNSVESTKGLPHHLYALLCRPS